MQLVEILLPLDDNDGRSFDASLFAQAHTELTDRFGGVTSFGRSPAHGVTNDTGKPVHDEIVIVEVMTDKLERDWWDAYRRDLESRFGRMKFSYAPPSSENFSDAPTRAGAGRASTSTRWIA